MTSAPQRAFPFTQHSLFERIRSDDTDVRRFAFDALVRGYWRPGYHYLRLRWRLTAEDAEDIVQAFFTTAFEKRYVERFDPGKARFRTFLRTCLDRFVQHERDAQLAEKRGGGRTMSVDFAGAERDVARLLPAVEPDRDAFFRDETIRALFARAVERLREDLVSSGHHRAFDVFARHDLGDESRSYAEVAEALGLTVTQVTNDLSRARRQFRAVALDELRAIAGTEREFRAEARDLFGFEVTG
jgi:RNA polymerase sigma factor (sigma-70 family)